MSRTRYNPAVTWLTLLAVAGAPAAAAPAPVETVPDSPAVTADDARALQGEGRWEEAVEAWKAVAGQHPDSGAAWFNLAYCLHAAGRLDEAIEMHKKASTFDDFHGIAMYNLGCAYALTGRPDDAIDALAEAQDAGFSLRGRVGSDPDLEALRGSPELAELLQREPAGWRDRLHQIMAGVQQWFSGPQVSGMLGKLQGAFARLQQRMADDERFAPLARKLQAWLGGHAGAETHADPGADRAEGEPSDRDAAAVTLQQAQAYQQAGDWDNAIDAYRALLVEEPENPAAWFGLAYCLHMNGDYEQAIEAHKEAASFEQIRGIALYNLACAYSLTGRTDESLEALRQSRDAGFDIAPARSDSDFDNVRNDPRFATLVPD